MAPAIVHFLVGASVVLFVAAPFALRYELDRNWGLWLVPLGGIWGIAPDGHHIMPVFRRPLYALHRSPVVDVFAFHYTLDTPTVRGLPLESTFAAIVFFLLAVATFSLTSTLQARLRALTLQTAPPPLERIAIVALATLLGTGYAVTAWGVVVRITDGFTPLAALVGHESLLIGWVVLVALGLVGGVSFGLLIEGFVPQHYARQPLAGGVIGVPLGIVAWLVGSFLGVPLWVRVAFGSSVSVPAVQWVNLGGLVVFGITFGTIFATIRGAFDGLAA